MVYIGRGDRRALLYYGYRVHKNTDFYPLKVYGKIKNERLKNNGQWTASRPDEHSYMRIHGSYFQDDCDGTEKFLNTPDTKQVKNHTSQIKRWSEDIRLTTAEPLYIDYKIFHNSSSVADFERLNVPFF